MNFYQNLPTITGLKNSEPGIRLTTLHYQQKYLK